MKRPVLLLSLIVCLYSAVYGQTRGVERQNKLNGAVQSLRVETGQLISLFGVGDSRPRLESRQRSIDCTYDASGNLLELIRYDEHGKAIQKELFRYGEKGRLVEETRFESKDQAAERVIHRYDPGGRRNESLQYDEAGKVSGRVTYVYDSAGRLAEKVSYKDDKPNGKAAFAYDEAGRESSFITYDSKGDIPNQIVTQYDDKANTSERLRSGLKGNLEGRTVTAYDSKGNVIVIDHFRSDGSPAWKWEFEYDDKGNVIREKLANKSSLSVWLYAYEYDSMGNWTKRSRSQLFDDRGKLVPHLSAVTFRSFKYYPSKDSVRAIAEPEERLIVRDPFLSMTGSEIRSTRAGAALASTNSPQSLGRPLASGTLQIEMTIDTEGSVEAARVVSGAEFFSQKPSDLEQSILKRTYKPVLLHGVPVKVVDTMKLEFVVPKPGRGKW